MSVLSSERQVTASDLEALVNKTDSSAFLAESRVLRRVIKYDCQITSLGLQVPHRKSYFFSLDLCTEDWDSLQTFGQSPSGMSNGHSVDIIGEKTLVLFGGRPADGSLFLLDWDTKAWTRVKPIGSPVSTVKQLSVTSV